MGKVSALTQKPRSVKVCDVIRKIMITKSILTDINECQSEKPCLLTEDCINTEGSYHCKTKFCNFGFELNHITGFCDDIDECESKQPHCGWNKHCVNTVGSFKCECNRGLRGDFYDQNFCVDVDECATPGTCHHSCQNSYGSFRCFCSHGFKLNSDNKTCSDVDECAVGGSHFCEKICKNTMGSYRCECPKGFKLFHRGLCNGKQKRAKTCSNSKTHRFFRRQRM